MQYLTPRKLKKKLYTFESEAGDTLPKTCPKCGAGEDPKPKFMHRPGPVYLCGARWLPREDDSIEPKRYYWSGQCQLVRKLVEEAFKMGYQLHEFLIFTDWLLDNNRGTDCFILRKVLQEVENDQG